MKVKPQFVASGVGANWLPAARALAMAALLALAATASEQTNGTWTGADGATWDTSAVNWSGFTFYQLSLARHGQGLLSRLPLPWRGSLCLARPLLAAPFGPSVMCFLRTSQCFGWPDPNFKHGRPLKTKSKRSGERLPWVARRVSTANQFTEFNG